MTDADDNPYRSPQSIDDQSSEPRAGEIVVFLLLLILVPPGIFVGLVLLAQLLTSGFAN